MFRKAFVIICFLAAISFILIFIFTDNKSDIYDLSDLGGVFSSDYSLVEFNNEISGRHLSYENEALEVYSSVVAGNKLSWGLKRTGYNLPPRPDPGSVELLNKYNAIYIGDTAKKTVYLTFDQGYENGYTSVILDTLMVNEVQAVFFITGPYLKKHEDLVKRMVDEGHIVGNHTINHPSLPLLNDENIDKEVTGLEREFWRLFKKNMKYLRPPKGEYSEKSLSITQKLGYTTVFWSFAYDDWYIDKQRGAEYAYKMVMSYIHNGAVILLHSVSKDNTEALDRIIKDTKLKGYRFGSLDELG